MNVILQKDNSRYASGVFCNNNSVLTWNSGSEDIFFLIIKSPYGMDFDIAHSTVLDFLNGCDMNIAEEVIISSNISAFLYKKISLIGYKCLHKPARYNVYVCDYDQIKKQIVVYYDTRNVACVDVGDTICFSISELNIKKPSLIQKLRKDVDTRRFVHVKAFEECPVGYHDGDLYYTYNGFTHKFPITRLMIKNGFMVPLYNNNHPIIRSYSNGFEPEIR